MKRNMAADVFSSFRYASDSELATYRWHILNVLSERRLTSLYELLEDVKLLSDDAREKQEYLEYLIQETLKEYDLIQKTLQELKKENDNNG